MDANEDGQLTDADLEPGQAAVDFTYANADGEIRRIGHTTQDGHVYYDTNSESVCPRWGVMVPVTDPNLPQTLAVFFWFADTQEATTQMAPGESEVAVVALDIPATEHGGEDYGPHERPLVVTESRGSQSSGWFQGQAVIDTAFYGADSPNGERYEIHGMAFRGVETDVPSGEPSCSRPGEPDSAPRIIGERFEPSE